MKYIEHWYELRKRLQISVIMFLLLSCCGFYLKERLLQILIYPLKVNGYDSNIVSIKVTEAFITYLKVSCLFGFVFVCPFLCYQVYKFIKPGLYRHEKFIANIVLLMSPALLWTGIFFALYLVMPKALQFLLSFHPPQNLNSQNTNLIVQTSPNLNLYISIGEYFNITTQLIFAFGLAFQLPIIIIILYLVGLVSIDTLKSKRRIAIVCHFIIAGFITPPDVVSQLMLAIPLVLLYEFSITCCTMISNNKRL